MNKTILTPKKAEQIQNEIFQKMAGEERLKLTLKIGVLGLQGAVSEHIEVLKRVMERLKIKGEVLLVRKKEDLDEISGLVIPGGESTTINRLLSETKIREKIIELANPVEEFQKDFSLEKSNLRSNPKFLYGANNKRLPILATCAGTILLAKEGDEQVKKTDTLLLGLLEIKVLRNAYGRQIDSFEVNVKLPEIGKKFFRAVFIRAPIIEKVWGETKIWAKYKNKIIGAKKGNILALTFHPELTSDPRIHENFLKFALVRHPRI